MNCKSIYSAYPVRGLLLSALLLLLVVSCIKEDFSDCPTGVNLSFRVTTPCNCEAQYPQEVDGLTVFLFDTSGLYAGKVEDPSAKISASYTLNIPLKQGQEYTLITWAGLKETYFLSPDAFIEGQTTLAQAMVLLNHNADKTVTTAPHPLYYGSLQGIASGETDKNRLTVDLSKITNDIIVTTTGLSQTGSYTVSITDDNGSHKFDNTIASGGKLTYISPMAAEKDGKRETPLRVMKLGADRHPVISIRNNTLGRDIYSYDLMELLLNNPDINLECNHTFYITLHFNNEDSDMSVDVVVNGWNVTIEDGELNNI